MKPENRKESELKSETAEEIKREQKSSLKQAASITEIQADGTRQKNKKEAQGGRVPMTQKEKRDRQIRKEAKASLILFFICMIWSIGFAYGLSGRTHLTMGGLPLWWILSVPGVYIVATIGTIILITKIFKNMDLDEAVADDPKESEVSHD